MAKKSNTGIFNVWMQKRSEENFEGLYEFPGGKIETNESPTEALIREVNEEVEIELTKADTSLFKLYPYNYPKGKVLLHSFLVKYSNVFESTLSQKGEWFELTEENINHLKDKTLPANEAILKDVKNYLEKNFKERELTKLWDM